MENEIENILKIINPIKDSQELVKLKLQIKNLQFNDKKFYTLISKVTEMINREIYVLLKEKNIKEDEYKELLEIMDSQLKEEQICLALGKSSLKNLEKDLVKGFLVSAEFKKWKDKNCIVFQFEDEYDSIESFMEDITINSSLKRNKINELEKMYNKYISSIFDTLNEEQDEL